METQRLLLALQHVIILEHHKGGLLHVQRARQSFVETAAVGFCSLAVVIINHVKLLLCHLR